MAIAQEEDGRERQGKKNEARKRRVGVFSEEGMKKKEKRLMMMFS